MVIYTVSQIINAWYVHRHDPATKNIEPVKVDLQNEDEAVTWAVLKAESDRPSSVIKISRLGVELNIAVFSEL